MKGNRQAATDFILKFVAEVTANDADNIRITTDYLTKMSDKEFEEFIGRLDKGEEHITFFAPNFKPNVLNVKRNLNLAKKYGHKFFERLWIEGRDDQPSYLTPIPYPVMFLPYRRASQTLAKKISVPDHSKVIDSFTGQVTGESKGARLSYPELQLSMAVRMEKTMEEMMKFRGGDISGLNAFNRMMSNTGRVNLSAVSNFSSGVESTKTLHSILTGMCLKNNL